MQEHQTTSTTRNSSKRLILLPGTLLLTQDAPEEKIGSILVPTVRSDDTLIGPKPACTGLVHAHADTGFLGEDVVGKRVAFVLHSERPLTWNGKEFVLIDEANVLAVLEDDGKEKEHEA
jgi:hypothetical protein